MSAQDNLGPQFMFHATSPSYRDSIAKTGLRTDQSRDEGDWKSVYMSERPGNSPDQDIWKLNVTGMRLDPDGDSGEDEAEVGKSYFSDKDIPPERLTLHRAGKRD